MTTLGIPLCSSKSGGMGSNSGKTVGNLLGTKLKIREIIWRSEGAPSESMCAAHEWAGIFPTLPPLHLIAGAKPCITTAVLELSQLLI